MKQKDTIIFFLMAQAAHGFEPTNQSSVSTQASSRAGGIAQAEQQQRVQHAPNVLRDRAVADTNVDLTNQIIGVLLEGKKINKRAKMEHNQTEAEMRQKDKEIADLQEEKTRLKLEIEVPKNCPKYIDHLEGKINRKLSRR